VKAVALAKLCAFCYVDYCTFEAEEKIILRGVKYVLTDARGVGEEKQRWMLGTGSLYFFTETWVAFSARATPLFTIALELPSLSRCLNRYARWTHAASRCLEVAHAKG